MAARSIRPRPAGGSAPAAGDTAPAHARARRRFTVAGVRWSAPQVLVSAFLVVVAAAYLIATPTPRSLVPPSLGLTTADGPPVTVEVRYVVVDAQGLERPGFAEVPLAADDPSARLAAALAALRDDLIGGGVWPAGVAAPSGYVLEFDRRRVAVIDVAALPAGVAIDVGRELAVVRSLVATARAAAAADDVRVTVAGEERSSLWGRVALGGG